MLNSIGNTNPLKQNRFDSTTAGRPKNVSNVETNSIDTVGTLLTSTERALENKNVRIRRECKTVRNSRPRFIKKKGRLTDLVAFSRTRHHRHTAGSIITRINLRKNVNEINTDCFSFNFSLSDVNDPCALTTG